MENICDRIVDLLIDYLNQQHVQMAGLVGMLPNLTLEQKLKLIEDIYVRDEIIAQFLCKPKRLTQKEKLFFTDLLIDDQVDTIIVMMKLMEMRNI